MNRDDAIKFQDVRTAYKQGDVESSKAAHDAREEHGGTGPYLGALVLGGVDGIITTFAVVAGVEGASLPVGVILVLGIANLIADGFSMATGNYLGAASEQEYYEKERQRELWEIEHVPDHEIEEVREIYAEKGFSGKLLEDIVAHITSDKNLWVDTMMREELDLIDEQRAPFMNGLLTFVAFIAFGSIPLIVYIIAYLTHLQADSSTLFTFCVAATLAALFGVGALKSRYSLSHWLKSGLETMAIGGVAGSISYIIGYLLRGYATAG